MVGAVDVYVAGVGVAIAALVVSRLESVEPEDACGDEIGRLLFGREFPIAFSGIDSAFEDGAERGVGAEFVRDSVKAGWGAEGVFEAGGRVFAGGDLEFAGEMTVFEEL